MSTDMCLGGDLATMLFLREYIKDDCVFLKYQKSYSSTHQEAVFSPYAYIKGQKIKGQRSVFPNAIGSKRAVVFRDSFFNAMINNFSEHFSSVLYVWDYGYYEDIIDEERRDIVVLEILERFLDRLLPENMRT